MKLRTVISLSLVSLIAVVLIQLGGMLLCFPCTDAGSGEVTKQVFLDVFHGDSG
ncbi:MAG: hypothetical protein ACLUE2_15145 [Bacteroides cellulosilyticus]